MGRENHPAEKSRERQREMVQANATIQAWWSAEKAAANEAEAKASMYRAASRCLIGFTIVACVASLVLAFRM
jgi:hypothetical protein